MAEPKKLPTQICEMYPSVNDGGHFSGYPVMVIRLFGASFIDNNDLHKNAWQFGQKKEDIEVNRTIMTNEEIISELNKFKQGDIFRWKVTGGEPLRQQLQLVDLIEKFIVAHGKAPIIEIRTRGHIAPIESLNKYVARYIVNVPLGNSMDGIARETFSHRIKEDVLAEFANNKKASFLFQIKGDNDFKEINEVIQMCDLPKNRVWVSPLELRGGAAKVNEACVWNACLNFGYKYFNRLSLQIFGPNKKKV